MNERNDKIKLRGTVKEILPGGAYLVILENEVKITCRVSGKMRQNKIHILPGDGVDVEMSLYDLTKGRIVYRYFN
ncbi:translation initiation factor IF-1 [Mycoplasmoides fastidiosum]|uniref:Translation initiation factor IF-1 n=1 Tax=Mycoplasmoides fastidiosum TaxID=92758 RepID=A0ABU0LY33_9BACT|nr:translation initiation factor IF-1 [Mycoplasmoides fastidiosum]MDQ0513612.1 translation initiation factor IF-1 [Mycoplasmoides fastidiosum]